MARELALVLLCVPVLACSGAPDAAESVDSVADTLDRRVRGFAVKQGPLRWGDGVEVPDDEVLPRLADATRWPEEKEQKSFFWVAHVFGTVQLDGEPAEFRFGRAKIGGQPTLLLVLQDSKRFVWELPKEQGLLLMETLEAATE